MAEQKLNSIERINSAESADKSRYVLEIENVTKSFPGVKALDQICFNLLPGEVHVIMGENGAGKSTLIKVITGVHKPDSGKIKVNGKEVEFNTTNDSAENKISCIYQHSTSYPHMRVFENIFMGHELKNKYRLLDDKKMINESRAILELLDSDIDPKAVMSSLSVAEQQIVEIVKAVSSNANIIIMDEPTASLSDNECSKLYSIVDDLKKHGKSIIFISHRLKDMYRLADRVSVFRDGKYIETFNHDELDENRIISAMVGRSISKLYPKEILKLGAPVLEVTGLTKRGVFKDISFNLFEGEILGLTGLVGSGRSEVCQAICGYLAYDSGSVILKGRKVNFQSLKEAMSYGIGYLPEDRQEQGLHLNWEIYRNRTLANLDHYCDSLGIKTSKEKISALEAMDSLDIRAKSIYSTVSSLSGGNQQKVVLAKILDLDPQILILDEPTKGVDVGAKAQIYSLMTELVKNGHSIIMISSEMAEILAMSDRIVVMHEGEISHIFEPNEADQESLLRSSLNAKR